MSKNITEHDAKIALSQLAREMRAKAILSKRTSVTPYVLTVGLSAGICSFLISRSGFEAPVIIQTLLVMGFISGILSALDNFVIRRRLDAAIDLLLLQSERLED
jgi:hypothetical protein